MKKNVTTSSKFPNGFTSWMETHHEVVSTIYYNLLDDRYTGLACEINDTQAQRGLYKLAETLTDKFENKYKGMDWE